MSNEGSRANYINVDAGSTNHVKTLALNAVGSLEKLKNAAIYSQKPMSAGLEHVYIRVWMVDIIIISCMHKQKGITHIRVVGAASGHLLARLT